MGRPAAVLLAVALLFGGCGGGGDDAPARLVLDGRPRYPDDQGVVTRVSRTSITLAGARTYRVSPKLQSFSTMDLSTQPLLQRKGQYVQVGLDGTTMVWIAGVAKVLPGTPPRVFYVGTLKRLDGKGNAVFADGTVLRLGAGVTPSPPKGSATVEIDPAAGVARRITMSS
ncbi:MAG TPA: hypothetical protein VM030_04835 [Acidimicrobiales bacterium]|nr:hypothetical protein [Acidimicrobiales bacterium]